MARIGIGIVGGGYMGKAHAVAMSAVVTLFATGHRPAPAPAAVAASSPATAAKYRDLCGFKWAAGSRQELVAALTSARSGRWTRIEQV